MLWPTTQMGLEMEMNRDGKVGLSTRKMVRLDTRKMQQSEEDVTVTDQLVGETMRSPQLTRTYDTTGLT